jgi:thiol-disulfide isomerase/thioredoxin
MTSFQIAFSVLIFVVLIVEGALLIYLLRGYGILLRRFQSSSEERVPSGLPIGEKAPHFQVRALDGSVVTLRDLLQKSNTLCLVFVTPTCGFCLDMLADVVEWQREYASKLILVVLAEDLKSDLVVTAERLGVANVLLREDASMLSSYRISSTPSAVMIDNDGKIASSTGVGAAAIADLLRGTVVGTAPAPGAS